MNILNKVISKIMDWIRQEEANYGFSPAWPGIFLNPFFITRRALFFTVRNFARRYGTGKKILDVGCGCKPYRHLFPASNYIGIDVRGRGYGRNAKTADKFFDGKNIPFPANSFGVVMATEVFEHVAEPEKLFKEMKRVLVRNGYLFITMPFVWPEHSIPYDYQRFTSYKHRMMLKQFGFKVISLRPTTGVFATAGQLINDFLAQKINTVVQSWNLKYFLGFFLVRLLNLIICTPVSILFLGLDRIFKSRGLTLDFAVIAQKS